MWVFTACEQGQKELTETFLLNHEVQEGPLFHPELLRGEFRYSWIQI